VTEPSPPTEPAQPPPKRKPVRRRRGRWLVIGLAAIGVLLAVLGGGTMAVFGTLDRWRADLPEIGSAEELWQVRRVPGMTFLDRNGVVLATRGPRYGRAVRLTELPLHVRRAFLAAEDVRYYEHGPVDHEAIARAIWANLRAGRTVEGGSTLTQQLARTLFLTRNETLKRKVQEWMLAERLEAMLGKDGVFELYLNRTFFGDNEYGLEAAAHGYFNKTARELTLAEAALLAAVPNAPSRLALTNDFDGAVARSHRILAIMREEGWITAEEELEANRHPPVLRTPDPPAEPEFSYVIDLAGRQAAEFSQGAASDLVVRMTVDPDLQRAGAAILSGAIAREGRRRNATQGALVALSPDGAVRAMVGGVDYQTSVFNRAAQARRQPGSAFKPIVYAAALERGVSPYDTRDDTPLRIGNWTPQNYGGHFSGRVTIREALARSINTVSVRLAMEVGTSGVAEFARRMGLTSIPANAGPSIALGAYEVTPLQLAGAYQVFQTGGSRTTPYLISEIADTRGNVIWAMHPGAGVPVYDRLRASQMVRMMEGVITSGTGRRADIGRPAAGKTGTSQNWRDAWFVGFTPDFLCAVWVGNDNGRSMAHVTGGEIPASIWRQFMQRAHRGVAVHDFDWLMPEPEYVPEYTAEGGDPYGEDAPMTEGELENPYLDDPDRWREPPVFENDPPPMPAGQGPLYEDEPLPEDLPPVPASHRRRAEDRAPPPRERWRPPVYEDDPPMDDPDPGYEDPDKDRPVVRHRY
jgi:penicillin-binding protein 1A